MNTRPVQYTSHRPSHDGLAEHFVMAEVEPPDGPHHALLVPRAWTPITPLPEAEAPDAPLVCALFLEGTPPDAQTASLQTHTVPRADSEGPDEPVDAFLEQEGLERTDREPSPSDGGVRVWARGGGHVVMIRVVPVGERWLVYVGRCPAERVQEVGGALDKGLQSLVIGPEEDPGWSAPVSG